ncbi:RIO1 family protein kinase [Yersinia pseudotuberculosis]|nr:RIO1 family protein kinase [Yersinia pseudotuberculosis]
MWALYEDGKLHPDTPLTGNFAESTQAADVDAVLDEIKAVIAEEQERLREAQEHNN